MARLGNGVRKRQDGTFEKRFTIDGKRYSIYAPTTKELFIKEIELRELINAGAYIKNASITLDRYFTEWKENKRNTIKPSTLNLYANHYKKHIMPFLGNVKIKDIERREVMKLQKDLTEILAPTTVNAVIKTLNILLNDAVKDEVITKNPASIKALKIEKKAVETYHRALTKDEQRIFMQALKDDYYYSFIALMILTGMRAGEVSALTWEDIDFKNNVIYVNKTTTKNDAGQLIVGTTPKTDAGKREIPINDNIRDLLKAYRSMRDILPFKKNNIFLTVRGNLIDNGLINRAISNTLKKLEKAGIHIDHFTSHAMRDTFATRYIEQGGNMQTLKTLLGHNSITLTMDLYAHVLPNTKAEEMQRIQIVI